MKTWWASWSEYVPSGSPGKQRFRFLPSPGETNGVRLRNEATFTIGTVVTEPASAAGSRPRISSTAPLIDEYSQPWMPAITTRCGPSRAPRAWKARPLVLAQGGGVEAQRAPLDRARRAHSPRPRVSATIVTKVR